MRNWLLILLIIAAACRPAPPVRQSNDLVGEGWENYRLGEYARAVQTFQQAEAIAATRVAALFGEAQTRQLQRPTPDRKKAAALYRQVLAEAPQSDYAAWSLLSLAWIKVADTVAEPGDVAAVQADFQKVLDQFPEHLAGQEAFLSLQTLKLQHNAPAVWRAVLAALAQFLQQHPRSPYTSAVHSMRAHCYQMLDEPANELAAVQQAWQTDEADPRNPKQNQVAIEWRIATLAEFDVGDFALARAHYRRLIAEYPTEQRVFLAKQELRHMDEIEAQLRQELARSKGGGQ